MTWGQLDVYPPQATLHVGATQHYDIEQEGDDYDLIAGHDVGPRIPTNWSVATLSGAQAIQIANFQRSIPNQYAIAAFDVHAIAVGAATIEITGEDEITTTIAVQVLP